MVGGLISVIMGVHDEKEEFLRLSVQSVIQQSYRNFEFIIIDDFSSVSCSNVLKELAATDYRIRLHRNEENLGLTKSLNIGLSIAQGEFIARMDADDYSVQDRFFKQVSFLRSHPEIDILGGGVVSFGNDSVFMSPVLGYSNTEAQCELFFQSTLCHPSVIMRRAFLDQHNLKYDINVQKGQDYDMWERCSIYGKLAVMKDVVLYYRTHSGQITSMFKSSQNDTARMVRFRRLNRLGLIPTEAEYECHLMLLGVVNKCIDCNEVNKWISKILSANERKKIVNQKALKYNLKYRLALYRVRNKKISFFDMFYLIKASIVRLNMRYKLRIIKNKIDKIKL